MIDELISLISCRTIGSKRYVIADINIDCLSEQHVIFSIQMVLPLLIIWVMLISLTTIWYLHSKFTKFDDIFMRILF
jgi:hypothetical protein